MMFFYISIGLNCLLAVLLFVVIRRHRALRLERGKNRSDTTGDGSVRGEQSSLDAEQSSLSRKKMKLETIVKSLTQEYQELKESVDNLNQKSALAESTWDERCEVLDELPEDLKDQLFPEE